MCGSAGAAWLTCQTASTAEGPRRRHRVKREHLIGAAAAFVAFIAADWYIRR